MRSRTGHPAVSNLEDRLEGKPTIPPDAGVILGELATRVAQLEERVLIREDRVVRVHEGEHLVLCPVANALCPDCGCADGHESSCPART